MAPPFLPASDDDAVAEYRAQQKQKLEKLLASRDEILRSCTESYMLCLEAQRQMRQTMAQASASLAAVKASAPIP
jgi:hypothetical protein